MDVCLEVKKRYNVKEVKKIRFVIKLLFSKT